MTEEVEYKKRVKRFTDPATDFKYEVDFDEETLTNVSLTPEEVVRIRSFKVKHTYTYKFRRELITMKGDRVTIFEVVDTETGRRRLTLKDELTGRCFPFSEAKTLELLEDLSSFMREKKEINLTKKDEWLLSVLSERYAFRLVKMVLESKNYGTTVKEVDEAFKFHNVQKARNVLAKFKRIGFFITQKRTTGEMFYMPTIKREKLEGFIKKLFVDAEEKKNED